MQNRSKLNILVLCQLSLLLLLVSCSRSPAQNLISINEVGYRPGDSKVAFTSLSVSSDARFKVMDAETFEAVYEGDVHKSQNKDSATGETVHRLDFSELKKPGTYQIWLPEMGIRSNRFKIGKDVYKSVATTAMESFYYQRCGTEIDNGTQWHHKACHLDDAVFYNQRSDRKDVTKGWHDAGDYGKFVVTTSLSVAFQLYLYDHQPDYFSDGQLNIPENSNGVPDVLDQARWGLEWLLKMQRDDGGVFHKVQKKKWTGEYLPQHDPDDRYIYSVSSTSTGDFAAVAALGARLFKTVDASFSENLKKASQKAWGFLKEHPNMVPEGGFKNPSDVKGGEYGDHKDSDERLWASVELYRLTGSDSYHNYFLENYSQLGGPGLPPLSWKNVAEFAYYSYLRGSEYRQDNITRKKLMDRLSDYANGLVQRTAGSGYGIVLNEDEYYWGSNSVVLGYTFTLIQAYELTGNKSFREAALDQLHYILGRNPFGSSYVTGVGSSSVQTPYHQFSMLSDARKAVPGMVVGGPNSQNKWKGETLSKYPAKAYEDVGKNYMVNETAINYTAPLIYVAGYFLDRRASITTINN